MGKIEAFNATNMSGFMLTSGGENKQQRTCAVCGKKFTTYGEEWGYTVSGGKIGYNKPVCSYECMRKWEKKYLSGKGVSHKVYKKEAPVNNCKSFVKSDNMSAYSCKNCGGKLYSTETEFDGDKVFRVKKCRRCNGLVFTCEEAVYAVGTASLSAFKCIDCGESLKTKLTQVVDGKVYRAKTCKNHELLVCTCESVKGCE